MVFRKLTPIFRNSDVNKLLCPINHKNLRKHKIKALAYLGSNDVL